MPQTMFHVLINCKTNEHKNAMKKRSQTKIVIEWIDPFVCGFYNFFFGFASKLPLMLTVIFGTRDTRTTIAPTNNYCVYLEFIFCYAGMRYRVRKKCSSTDCVNIVFICNFLLCMVGNS